MISIRAIIIGIISGMLIGGGWWAFFDGVVYAPDAFPWIHILPPTGSTIAFICINLVTLQQMKEIALARVWTFVFLTIGCVSIGGAMWITAVEYPPDISSNWPGVAIILQTIMLLFASILFFIGRSNLDENKYAY